MQRVIAPTLSWRKSWVGIGWDLCATPRATVTCAVLVCSSLSARLWCEGLTHCLPSILRQSINRGIQKWRLCLTRLCLEGFLYNVLTKRRCAPDPMVPPVPAQWFPQQFTQQFPQVLKIKQCKCKAKQCKAKQCKARQCKAKPMQSKAKQSNAKQSNAEQSNIK